MKTERLKVDPDNLETAESAAALDEAARIVRAGGLVAMPTETVYGLGANALDRQAVERIFAAKQRPAWDPIIVHVDGAGMARELVTEAPEAALRLMDAYWPGPLTLLLPRTAAVPDVVTAGRPLVGLRVPSHPVALALIRRAGTPIAAPSANRFSHVSPTTAEHVLHDLDGRIDAVLDAGPALHGVESTVLDPGRSPMLIYRPGAVTAQMIERVAGPVEVFEGGAVRESPAEALPSPGVGMRHYAPRARLVLLEATESDCGRAANELALLIDEAVRGNRSKSVGVMLPEGIAAPAEAAALKVFRWGSWDAPETMAQLLYAGLRWLDEQGCTVIVCPLPPRTGIGAAIRDRLSKGARNA